MLGWGVSCPEHVSRRCVSSGKLISALFRRPNNIITSAVAADLASHPSVRGSKKSLGTVTGLINGCGSITASIGLLAVGPLQDAFGWSSVWLFLMGCTFTGTALMGPKIKEELFPVGENLDIFLLSLPDS